MAVAHVFPTLTELAAQVNFMTPQALIWSQLNQNKWILTVFRLFSYIAGACACRSRCCVYVKGPTLFPTCTYFLRLQEPGQIGFEHSVTIPLDPSLYYCLKKNTHRHGVCIFICAVVFKMRISKNKTGG